MYQEPTRGTNQYNASVITGWKDRFPVPISLEDLKAWELMKARATQMDITHRITCRYTPEIQAVGRFDYHGRHFDIYSVENVDNRNRELVILANEVKKPTA